jgi:NAD(P)-dependent dehydrogenase (short-subunit alcohol dehydrogenase family)
VAFIEIEGGVGVLTGAGSGIGRATALELARRGMRLVVSDALGDRALETAAMVTGLGGEALGLRADVTDTGDLEALRAACLGHFGTVDLVMNNVGVIAMGPPESLPLAEWQRVIDVNLLGIVRSNLVFLPHLIAQGRGHVVNTASVSGLLAHGFDRLPYVTTKHAVVGMSESLALYLRPQGIGVTCVCPSGVATNIVEQISFFGPATRPRSPDHPIVEAEVVGRLVADAVESDRFLVLTVPKVVDELIERATDIEGYVRDRSRPAEEQP